MVRKNIFNELVEQIIESNDPKSIYHYIDQHKIARYLRDLSYYVKDLKSNEEEVQLRYVRINRASNRNQVFLYYELVYEILNRIAPELLLLYNSKFYSLVNQSNDISITDTMYSNGEILRGKDVNRYEYITSHSIKDIEKNTIYFEVYRTVRLDCGIKSIDYPTTKSPNGYFSFCYINSDNVIFPIPGVIGYLKEWGNIINKIKINDSLLLQIKNIERAILFNMSKEQIISNAESKDSIITNNKRKKIDDVNELKRDALKVVSNTLFNKLSSARIDFHNSIDLELVSRYIIKIDDLKSKNKASELDKLNKELNVYYKSPVKIEMVLRKY